MNLAVVGSSVSSVASVVSTIDRTVADGAVARDTSVAVVDSGDHSNVVGVSGGVGVVLGKAVSNLSEGVSLSVSLRVGVSLTLAVVVSAVASVADVSSRVASIVSTVADGAVTGDTSMSVVNTSDHSNIMRVASGISIGLGKTIGNLTEGVSIGLSIRVSLGGNDGQEDLDRMFVKRNRIVFREDLQWRRLSSFLD